MRGLSQSNKSLHQSQVIPADGITAWGESTESKFEECQRGLKWCKDLEMIPQHFCFFFYLFWLSQGENKDLNNNWSSPGGTNWMDNAGVHGNAQGMEQNLP